MPAMRGDQRRFYAGLRNSLRSAAQIPVQPIDALVVTTINVVGVEAALLHAETTRS